MIKEIRQACERLNEKLGISVSLPSPGKEVLKAASVCNYVVGAGLVTAGVVFSSKLCTALGGISVISGAVLRQECDHVR